MERTTRLVVLLSLVVIASADALSAAEPAELVFPRFNDTFVDSAPEITPVSAAGMQIEISSPSNSLTVLDHSILLTPLGAGRHRFAGTVQFRGKAELTVNIDTGAAPAALADTVLLPTQEVALEGELEISRTASGGYLVTTHKLPAEVQLAMQSKLGNQLLSMCDLLSILSGMDCSGIGASFSQVRLPFPPAGDTYEIRVDQLAAEERAMIDAYLNASQP